MRNYDSLNTISISLKKAKINAGKSLRLLKANDKGRKQEKIGKRRMKNLITYSNDEDLMTQ